MLSGNTSSDPAQVGPVGVAASAPVTLPSLVTSLGTTTSAVGPLPESLAGERDHALGQLPGGFNGQIVAAVEQAAVLAPEPEGAAGYEELDPTILEGVQQPGCALCVLATRSVCASSLRRATIVYRPPVVRVHEAEVPESPCPGRCRARRAR